MPWPGFEPGLLRPQRRVLTTRRSRLAREVEWLAQNGGSIIDFMPGRCQPQLTQEYVSRFSWCSGYHICLTHRRSPVRSRAKTAVPRGLTARISGFHPEGPGSTPGVGNFCLPKKGVKIARAQWKLGQAQSKPLPSWAKVGFIHPHNAAPLQNEPTAPCIPRRSPIQVLTWLNVA